MNTLVNQMTQTPRNQCAGVELSNGASRTLDSGRTPRAVRPHFVLIAFLIFVALTLFRTHFRLTLVSGNSMLPTYQTGDLLLIDVGAYGITEPERGDLVVARHRNDLIVKRVVGLPGEQVEINNGILVVDGQVIHESHPIERGFVNVRKGKIAGNKFALFGDNRALPSRLVVPAVVSKDQIIGKVRYSFRLLPRPSNDDSDKS
jgi:signal peptidase I